MSDSSNGGLSIATTVTIVFVILKLVDVIDWSWLLVFSPMIAGIVFWITIAFLIHITKSPWE